MSWDAGFYVTADGHSVHFRDWNYTHNCNRMANEVLGGEASWWQALDGSDGVLGSNLLGIVLMAFDADPDHFRALNPDNGWGDFDSFRSTLREMYETSRKFPTGRWAVGG